LLGQSRNSTHLETVIHNREHKSLHPVSIRRRSSSAHQNQPVLLRPIFILGKLQRSRCNNQTSGWTIKGSWLESRQPQMIFSSSKRPAGLIGPPSSVFNVTCGIFKRGQSGRIVEDNTHLQLVPRSRISGATPLLPHTLYDFLACTRTSLPYHLSITLLYTPLSSNLSLSFIRSHQNPRHFSPSYSCNVKIVLRVSQEGISGRQN
jgi:hypothetical protein